MDEGRPLGRCVTFWGPRDDACLLKLRPHQRRSIGQRREEIAEQPRF